MSRIPTLLPVKYKCGHTEKRDLARIAPSKRRAAASSDFWATRAGRDGTGLVCRKCFDSAKSVDREQRMRQWMLDIEQFETEHQLPDLRGTEKQHNAGLVDSARRDRHTVLTAVLDDETTEYPEQRADVLEAAKALTRAGWWTNNLGFKIRTDADYGQDEYVELIFDGAREIDENPTEHIENENPHDWTDGQ